MKLMVKLVHFLAPLLRTRFAQFFLQTNIWFWIALATWVGIGFDRKAEHWEVLAILGWICAIGMAMLHHIEKLLRNRWEELSKQNANTAKQNANTATVWREAAFSTGRVDGLLLQMDYEIRTGNLSRLEQFQDLLNSAPEDTLKRFHENKSRMEKES